MNLNPSRQQGVVLVIGLLVLLMVTLMAVSGFNLTQSNLKVVGNMESREQAVNAANAAIEEAVSATRFVTSPASIFPANCTGANTRCYDTNADGADDVTVTIDPPRCVVIEPIKISDLDLSNPNEAGCVVQKAEGVSTDLSDISLCANSVWELRAVAVDNVTQARAEVTQGVSLKVALNDVATACPD